MNCERFKIGGIGSLLICCLFASFYGCEKPVSPPLSPDQALKTFQLADEQLKIELVASEPLVQDPVAIAFDEGGRLWVAEMLGFMQDIDGTGEEDKIGRISVLFDDDGDGKMDRRQTFLDSLVLPRALAVVKGGALIAENMPLWYVSDTDGDYKADTKVLIDSLYGGLGVPEHSANGLLRGMDNWFYNAKSKYRYKMVDGKWIKDETEFRGQWGICHDDAGRLFYNYNWSQLHVDLVPPNALLKNKNHKPSSGTDHGLILDRRVYPIRSNTAINRGYVPGTLDENGSILEFASACGPLINRGHALPPGYYGDAFVCEPTANLIKQNEIIAAGFMLRAENTYKNKEFLASTDERFRPISLASGPDGALYVVDMYKGIIQHAPYMTEYLREETLKRGLDQPIHMGRIWRITSKKDTTDRLQDLSEMNVSQLVAQLYNTNGWTRDTAQRLLIEKNDLSVISQLVAVLNGNNALAKLHALWVLEGLAYDEPDLLFTAMRSKDPLVAQAALRLVAQRAKLNADIAKELEGYIQENYDQADPSLKMQMVLSSDLIGEGIALDISRKFISKYGQLPVARDIVISAMHGRESAMLAHLLAHENRGMYNQNLEIFFEMLATAITNSQSEKAIEQLQGIVETAKDSAQVWIKNAIINGMSNATHSNSTIASANTLTHIDQKVFAAGRQNYINLCASCHGTQGEGMKRFAPPLKQSEWVTGDEKKLAMLLLHGMQGPVEVNGKKYDSPDILPEMPSFSTLQNEEIAAIATYIRNAWGNVEPEVTSRTVGSIRFRTQGKISPWTATELDTLVFDLEL
ncbi:MAG: c-type cytochrome [Maribacter sp.]|uniref:DUF7133 domain-containing protein n=1 Tax=Maribacter sp. TaxID=1897614 RepID=UPI003298C311